MTVTTKFPNGVSIGKANASSGVMAVARASFDPTSVSQIELFTLPAGAVVVDVLSYGGSTGGTNPTVDVGSLADDDGFANEIDADSQAAAVSDGLAGALVNTVLAADTVVYGKVGSSAATGGTTSVAVLYVMTDT